LIKFYYELLRRANFKLYLQIPPPRGGGGGGSKKAFLLAQNVNKPGIFLPETKFLKLISWLLS